MKKRRIGTLEVSVVGLGCNNFGRRVDANGTSRVISAAVDAGINFLDTADIYSGTLSEEFIGQAIQGKRSQVILATKFGMALDDQRKGAHPAYVQQAAEDSLRRLKTDHIDLYQLHQPDPATPIADTLAAMDDLVRQGKVREIGCSNFNAAQLEEAAAAVRQGAARFVSVQNAYSLLQREAEVAVLPACDRLQMSFLPFYPLASGLLSGKYRAGDAPPESARFGKNGFARDLFTPANLQTVDVLRAVALDAGIDLLQLAFSWLLARKEVASVIAGAMTVEQVQTNAQAYVGELSPALWAKLNALLRKDHD